MVVRLTPLWMSCEAGLPEWRYLKTARYADLEVAAEYLVFGRPGSPDGDADRRVLWLASQAPRYFVPPCDWPSAARAWGLDTLQLRLIEGMIQNGYPRVALKLQDSTWLISTQLQRGGESVPAVARIFLQHALAHLDQLCRESRKQASAHA